MKKKIIFLFVWLITNISFAQETNVIIHKPHQTSNYLVLKTQIAQSNIDVYSIEIIQYIYSDFELINQEIVEEYQLVGKNFIAIPVEYTQTDNMYIKVKAYLENDEVLTEITSISPQQPGGSNYELHKGFECIGRTYAYRIDQYKHKYLSESYLSVSPLAAQKTPVVWHYQYFPESVWNTFNTWDYINNSSTPTNFFTILDYYNLTSLNSSDWPNTFTEPNNYLNPHVDGWGNPIVGATTVVGVKKYLGPWAGSINGNCLHTVPFLETNIVDIAHAISLLNQYGSPVPCGMYPLSCDGLTYNSSVAKIVDEEHEIVPIVLDTIVWYWDIIDEFQTIAQLEVNEENWEPYAGIEITQLSGEGNTISSLSMDNLFDPEGERINIPLNLDAGLYDIRIRFNDNSIYRIVEEIEDDSYNPNNMANNISVVIYPVPIQENSFYLNLSSSQYIECVYSLYDFNGNLLYETNIEIEQGQTEPILIEAFDEIPFGHLINVFHFADDSQLSILTVKNEY